MTSQKNTVKPLPTQERLRELLDYDSNTGVFRWRINKPNSPIRAGQIAGSLRKDGYRAICLNGKKYFEHRLAFSWMTGSCPNYIDHINRKPSDNRWTNLRPTTLLQNQGNRKQQRNNTSGARGVSWHKTNKKWNARIKINGETMSLGFFDYKENACKAYAAAALARWGEYLNFDGEMNAKPQNVEGA